VRYVSSGQARAEFSENDGTAKRDLVGLPVEAFPASLEVDIRQDMTDAELKEMVGKLRQLPVIDDVETYQAWTERLSHLVRGGVLAALLLAVVVFASVLAVVGSTIRLALQRRKTEVEVMRLVGATDRFIKGPFLLEGTFQGVVGAACALLLLACVFFVVRSKLDIEFIALMGVEPTFLPWQVAAGLLATGGLLGLGAAFLGLRRLVSV
jgi:cell division transport system permease protein